VQASSNQALMKLQSKSWLSKNRMQLKYLSIGLFIFFILFTGKSGSAQNLIPNPSFEIYVDCPSDPVEGDWDNQIVKAFPWTGPGLSTDYFNSCANGQNSSCWYNVPNCLGQNARTGSAFSMITTLSNTFDCREYLQVPLIENLQLNSSYYIKVYLSFENKYSAYASNNLGILFTDSIFTTPYQCPNIAPFTPQVMLFGNPILCDTLNEWFKVDAVYKAFGNEAVFTLGNFENNQETLTKLMDSTINTGYTFYYVDDVLVEEITQPFWQYHDTTVYYGDSVLIGPALTGLDIDWYTDNLDFISNAPGIYVTPPASRDYIAKETFDGVETTHVVHVTVIGGAGLEENELQNVRVFPNPSKGSFSISGIASDKPLRLEVRDVHGKLVFEEKAFSKELNSFALDVENGIYFVTVSDLESKSSVVEKLVVQR
jgi:hypothetical protein